MQVDRQPSPWPCVLMLAGLLLFCLMAPRYWQDSVAPEVATIGPATETLGDGSALAKNKAAVTGNSEKPNFAGAPFKLDNANVGRLMSPPNGDLINIWGPPTIDDYIGRRAVSTPLVADSGHRSGETFDWPVFVQTPTSPESGGSQPNASLTAAVQPSPEINAALEFVGRLLARYLPVEDLPRLVARMVDESPRWLSMWTDRCASLMADCPAAQAASPNGTAPRSTVRVVGPRDRLAMLPAPRELDTLHTWCVPQVLFELLDRLASQPDSAQWASQVRNQLHGLTDREQLAGDDVQAILGDLSDLAEDAVRMADATANDRLRVELLRAHWALARRLDCWAAMHEKRVAIHFQGRVAARGSLSPYFEGAPNQAPVPADIMALSNDLERYESGRDPKLGRYVARRQQMLKSSADAADRTLADAVEQHYRNANIRVAITAEMLNRLVGEERTQSKPIQDQIAGTFVHGQSNVHSESRVLLDPSSDEWQLELSAKGVVESNTLADGGPVQFRSRGRTDFSARKSIVVNDKGIQLKTSDVDATCRNRLVGVTTDYDWVPIFGGYARDQALGEYRARESRVKSQIESRVTLEASETLDEQTRKAVDQVREQTYDRVASQLDEYGIKLTPVEMKTTPDRLVARVRVARQEQLGSHTPRPRALSDSLASAQVHETALTNLAVTLGLDGKRFTAPELQKMLRETFPQVSATTPIETRADTVFQFAAEDAVQVHINDGRLELTISFASIELQNEAMQDVVVHASYVPVVNGLNAELVRDGTLGIEGRFSSTERARLHNVFNRVLPPERHLPIVHVKNPEDKRFEGLMITQLVLEDGWAGLAVGPTSGNRVAERSRSLR